MTYTALSVSVCCKFIYVLTTYVYNPISLTYLKLKGSANDSLKHRDWFALRFSLRFRLLLMFGTILILDPPTLTVYNL
jgi:hypothetical protein